MLPRRPVTVLLLLILASATASMAAAAAPAAGADEPSCEEGGRGEARRAFPDPRRPDVRVVVDVVCVADAGAEAVPGDIADGCTSTAYALGAHRWTSPLTLRVDARGSGLPESAVLAAMTAGARAWDDAAAADVFSAASLGGDAARAGNRDGVNQIGWRALGATGVLARTTTWYTSGGAALETDAVYNTDYAWSTTGARGAADLQGVAAHEIGHALGLDHAATGSANACLTMYPSIALGSTAQRTLGAGDVLGIQRLYGKPASVPFEPTFSPKPGNDWWVELRVSSDRALAGVTASVDGGAPVALATTSWGSWAKSFHVPKGSLVRFTAHAADGSVATSGAYSWPDAKPAPETPPLQATFVKHAANTWWIEARVSADAPIAGVAASVNGGAPVALSRTSWGTWAKSVHVPTGSTVVFTATATDGRTATSAPFPWP